jgi:signal transduction histidine kinase
MATRAYIPCVEAVTERRQHRAAGAGIATSLRPDAGVGTPRSDRPIRLAEPTNGVVALPIVQDALCAVVLTATSLVGVVAHLNVDLPEGPADVAVRGLDALGIALILLQTVPLAWRRTAPLLVLSVTAAAFVLFSLLGYFPSFAGLGFLVALYTVAAHRDRRTSIAAGIASAMVAFAVLLIGREPVQPDGIIVGCLLVGTAWFLGDGLRIRRGHVVILEDRAVRLEREREGWVQRAVGRERRVIARELHDVVAHNVSVVVAQAGAAQRILDSRPDEARAALAAIEHSGREALVEMRRLMGFLRTESDGASTLSPQPGLRNLAGLLTQVEEAGTPVTLRVEGDPRQLPAGLDLSAFRIVQEALTNVLRHAGPATAEVVIRYGATDLELTITDDGAGLTQPLAAVRQGYGQLGMRERVGLFGGRLRISGQPGAEYRVWACLPLDGEAT